MTSVKTFFNSILSDVDGQQSSKRLITLVAFALLAIAFLSNIFFEIPLQEFVFNGMMYLVCVGLGVTAAEKFRSNDKKGA
jgi:high-affinity Fe2+/Pb2+ permease